MALYIELTLKSLSDKSKIICPKALAISSSSRLELNLEFIYFKPKISRTLLSPNKRAKFVSLMFSEALFTSSCTKGDVRMKSIACISTDLFFPCFISNLCTCSGFHSTIPTPFCSPVCSNRTHLSASSTSS